MGCSELKELRLSGAKKNAVKGEKRCEGIAISEIAFRMGLGSGSGVEKFRIGRRTRGNGIDDAIYITW